MAETDKLGPWVRRFLLEHLATDRNLSPNTQLSYRDTLILLISFVVLKTHRQADQLSVSDVSPNLLRQFLLDLENGRRSSVSTRNQRLAAIRSLAGYIGLQSPEHIAWSGEIRAIPFKRFTKTQVSYLEKPEMDALLAEPNRKTAQGQRDFRLLLFLYNTGARASEIAGLCIKDLDLARDPEHAFSSVTFLGKGNKKRRCPLWPLTAAELALAIEGRGPSERVFLNRVGQPITRFGIHQLVKRCVQRIAQDRPSLIAKKVSPHVIRHTAGTHLLRAGVDINTIRAWLGHVSLETTNIYAEIDLQTRARALALCEPNLPRTPKPREPKAGLMSFLHSL
jgi:site-specific recombinase XerD